MYKVSFKKTELTEHEKIQNLCSKHNLIVYIIGNYYYFGINYFFFYSPLFYMLICGSNISTLNEYHKYKQKLKNSLFFEELSEILKMDLVINE